jgi:hypothetical protein
MQEISLLNEQLLACLGLLHGGSWFVSSLINQLLSERVTESAVGSEDVNWRVY